MKTLLSTTILFLVITTHVIAQQRRTDDALLLEYYQNQRFADALTYLKGIYQEPVTDAKELSRLAYTSSKAGKILDAEGYYQRIFEKDSTNLIVLYNIAGINQQRGNNAKAETYYKKIIAIDSSDFNVYKQLAQIAHEKGEVKSRMNQVYYLQKANSLNPTDADVAAELSGLYIQLKQFPKADKTLRLAIDADPENVFLQQSLLKLNYAEK